MTTEKILYKKDTKGKIRVLIVSTDGAELVQKSGVLNGQLVEHRKTCKAKNVGKVNGTTPEQQAIAEMNSKIKDELDGGYYETIEEAENDTAIFPMLAKDYGKESKKINWVQPVFAQPKLDGMRCLGFVSKSGKVKLMSRDGKIIQNMGHIEKQLSTIGQEIILDGELYQHGLTFQENMSLIKRYQEGKTEFINYNVYDVVEDRPFHERVRTLGIVRNFTSVLEVMTVPIYHEVDLQNYHETFVAGGYEGTIVRHGEESYKAGARSSHLLKYKDFIDIAESIVDVIPGDQRPEWGVPVFYLNGDPNMRFEAGTRMTHEQRIDLLTNKNEYLGKTAEVRFFQYTDKGVPRFPVMVGFRLDK